MINAGKYNKKISIFKAENEEDNSGFSVKANKTIVLNTFASIKTTKGFTLLASGSDFEKAYINFIIRYPKIEITRDMKIMYNSKIYTIEYLNNIDEANIELEIQTKEVTK